MELKERKRINNQLPGYSTGYNGLLFIPGQTDPWTRKNYWDAINYPRQYSTEIKFDPSLVSGLEKNIKPITIDRAYPSAKDNFKNFGGQAIQQGVLFAGNAYNSFSPVKSVSDLNMSAGTAQGNVNGFGYQYQRTADESAERDELRKENMNNTFKTVGSGAALGATVGSIFPGVGTVVGGLAGAAIGGLVGGIGSIFRKNKLKKQIEEQKKAANRSQVYERSGAMSNYLAQDYALNYGNQEDQMLYGFKYGKDFFLYGSPDAVVAKNEGVVDDLYDETKPTKAAVVKQGVVGKDTVPANLKNDTIVYGGDQVNSLLKSMLGIQNKNIKYQDLARPAVEYLEYMSKTYERPINNTLNNNRGPLGRQTDELQLQTVSKLTKPAEDFLKLVADFQKADHLEQQYLLMYKAKKGKDCLPGAAKGWPSWTVDSLGALTGLYLFIDAKNLSIKAPRSYVDNPYENVALQGLAGLRINPYPIMSQMRNQERRNLYDINRAGGLSGALKAYANVASGIGTLRNIALLNSDIQNQNNQYRSGYYSSLLNAGQANRQARMAANQYDLDYYSKAHAARQQMQLMGIYNMLNSIQQGYSNWWKKNQFDRMYNLYAADVNKDKLKYLKPLG